MANAITNPMSIPPRWIGWIEENRILGIEEPELIDILVKNGFDRRVAREQVARASLETKGAEKIAQKLQN